MSAMTVRSLELLTLQRTCNYSHTYIIRLLFNKKEGRSRRTAPFALPRCHLPFGHRARDLPLAEEADVLGDDAHEEQVQQVDSDAEAGQQPPRAHLEVARVVREERADHEDAQGGDEEDVLLGIEQVDEHDDEHQGHRRHVRDGEQVAVKHGVQRAGGTQLAVAVEIARDEQHLQDAGDAEKQPERALGKHRFSFREGIGLGCKKYGSRWSLFISHPKAAIY